MTKKRKDENASGGDTPVEEGAPVEIPAESKSLEPRAIEAYRDEKGTAPKLFAAAKKLRGWPDKHVVSEAEYDAAVAPTVELWREVKKTPAWLFAAAKTLRRWPHGKVLSEADYDAAIRDAGAVQLTSPTVRTR